MIRKDITNEEIEAFFNGHDPMERIIAIETSYMDDFVCIVYINENGEKRVKKEPFKPFVWAKYDACVSLYEGNQRELRSKLREYGIWVKALDTTNVNGNNERIENGYRFMFYATKKMSYNRFLSFFSKGGVPIHERQKKGEQEKKKDSSKQLYLSVTPTEQYMIASGKRMFKGYNSYDDLKRFIFDLETEGLNPLRHRIQQIGMWTNKGFHRIVPIDGETEEEKDYNELNGIREFLYCLSIEKPDIVIGHNSENFDWDFIMRRCDVLGISFEDLSKEYFAHPIYKKNKETVLKLGGEVEYYRPTIFWGHNVIDSLHASRRAQAVDSNMKSSNLKYVTKYLKMGKKNRVYVPGDKITTTWGDDKNTYAFNDEDGEWYKITDKTPLRDGFEEKSGRYIVERYLLDDLWETDKVEEKLNETNFLIGKWIPTTFQRACTMGTAGIWKLIMLAWSFENDLAIPSLGKNRRFVGGLSRLLKTGFVSNIVKLDYNSLYPATILTWNIKNSVDGSGILNRFLEFILTTRELYKGLKKQYGKQAEIELDADKKQRLEAEAALADKKQSQVKVLANSYFGSSGSPSIWPWADDMAAEKTTCLGRMQLRLMISHFKKLGYKPIVGDSFTSDTPLFIKYNDTGYIDIKPICELIGETEVDALGREYDTSEKPFKVLCRSGWVNPSYIYRHKTNKPLYEVSEGNMSVCVTEDHSLFNDEKEKIKPSEIDNSTRLEYYNGDVVGDNEFKSVNETRARRFARWLKNGSMDRVALPMFNTSSKESIEAYLDELKDFNLNGASKTCLAGINFLKKKVEQSK